MQVKSGSVDTSESLSDDNDSGESSNNSFSPSRSPDLECHLGYLLQPKISFPFEIDSNSDMPDILLPSVRCTVYPDEVFMQYYVMKNCSFMNAYPSQYYTNYDKLTEDIFKLAEQLIIPKYITTQNMKEMLLANYDSNLHSLEQALEKFIDDFIRNFNLVHDADLSLILYNRLLEQLNAADKRLPLMYCRNPIFFNEYLQSQLRKDWHLSEMLLWLHANYNFKNICFDPNLSLEQCSYIDILLTKLLPHYVRQHAGLLYRAKILILKELVSHELLHKISSAMDEEQWSVIVETLTNSPLLADGLKECLLEYDNLQSRVYGNRESPKTMVQSVLVNEGVDFTAEVVDFIVNEITKAIQANIPNIEELQANFHDWVRAICNRLELAKLYRDLEREFAQSYVETIMSNWEVIGTDIRDNKRVLSPDERKVIIKKARDKLHAQAVTADMANLESKLLTGEIPANPKVVRHQFGRLFTLMDKDKTQNVDTLLKRALVIQTLQKPNYSKISVFEGLVYKAMGCTHRD